MVNDLLSHIFDLADDFNIESKKWTYRTQDMGSYVTV